MYKYQCLMGSKMLGLKNTRDEDWITFADCSTEEGRNISCKSIDFVNLLIKSFIDAKNVKYSFYHAVYLYQLSSDFINETEYPFNYFNVLEYKKQWIQWLKAFINSKAAKKYAEKDEYLPKYFYHILYQYHMIIENIHWISSEAKANVQKIHDLEMPSSYFYELRDLINSLEYEGE